MTQLSGLPNYPRPKGPLGGPGDPGTTPEQAPGRPGPGRRPVPAYGGPGPIEGVPTTDSMAAIVRGRRGGRRELVGVVAVVLVMACGWWMSRPNWPTVRVPLAGPTQTDAEAAAIEYRGATLTPLARFEVDGIVVGVERYWLDGGARYSPVDIGLAWGLAAEPDMFRVLNYSQSGRFLWWRTAGPLPITQEELDASIANIHTLPASGAVRRQLTRLDPGDRVLLEGWLVSLNAPGGYVWRSSLVRTDTGNGACELMFVERVTRL